MGKSEPNGNGSSVEKEYLIILCTFVADVTEGWTRKPIRHRFDVTVSPRRIAVVIPVWKGSGKNNNGEMGRRSSVLIACVGHATDAGACRPWNCSVLWTRGDISNPSTGAMEIRSHPLPRGDAQFDVVWTADEQ